MAVLPKELKSNENIIKDIIIKEIKTRKDFVKWAKAVNNITFDGYEAVHCVNHYNWAEKGLVKCFAIFDKEKVIAVNSIFYNKDICSPEFVAVDALYRRQGLAKSICQTAVRKAFDDGAKIVTLRAEKPGTRELYTSLGFKIYNHALQRT